MHGQSCCHQLVKEEIEVEEVRSPTQGYSGHRSGKSQGMVQSWLIAESLPNGASLFPLRNIITKATNKKTKPKSFINLIACT